MAATSPTQDGSIPNALNGQGDWLTLRKLIDQYRIKSLTDLETFTSYEIREDHGLPGDKIVKSLRTVHAIAKVGETKVADDEDSSGRHVNVYEWREDVAGWVDAQVENRSELPCGCRAHIHREDGEFSCKKCADADWRKTPTFDRETVEEAMADV